MVVGALMDPGYKKVKATTDRETSTTRRFSHRYKRFAPRQLEHECSLSLYNTVPALTLITLASRCQHRPRLSLTQALITGVSPISRHHMSPHPLSSAPVTDGARRPMSARLRQCSGGGSRASHQSRPPVLFWPLKPHHRLPRAHGGGRL